MASTGHFKGIWCKGGAVQANRVNALGPRPIFSVKVQKNLQEIYNKQNFIIINRNHQ